MFSHPESPLDAPSGGGCRGWLLLIDGAGANPASILSSLMAEGQL